MRRFIIVAAIAFGAYYLYQNFAAPRAPQGPGPATTQNSPINVDGNPLGNSRTTPSTPNATADVSGSWNYTLQMPDGQTSGTLTLWGTPDDLQGMMSNVIRPDESESLENVRLSGTNLSFQIPSQDFGTISFTSVIRGQSMNGSMNVSGMEPFAFKANAAAIP